MEDSGSKSYEDGRMQIEKYHGNGNGNGPTSHDISGMQDLRCYSASYASSAQQNRTKMADSGFKFKKGKSANGSTSKSWSFNDSEMQRKKRVASYKVYTVEGKLKGSLRKSFRWLKDRYNRVVYGC